MDKPTANRDAIKVMPTTGTTAHKRSAERTAESTAGITEDKRVKIPTKVLIMPCSSSEENSVVRT